MKRERDASPAMMDRPVRWARVLRGVSVLVAVALFAGSCGATDEPAEPAVGPDSTTGEVDATVDETIERLAAAGIAVFPDEGGDAIVDPVEPVSPVQLLRWQARNMTLEASGGGGLLGSDLDSLVVPDPEHPDAPPPAQFLAAYVHGVETPGAELARELVGDQDLTHPDGVVFPTMAVTLFVSDLARAAEELPSGDGDRDSEGEGVAGVVDLSGAQPIASSQAICPDFAGFINTMIADVVRILKVQRILVPDTGIPILNSILQAGADLFVGFLNFAIDAAATLVIATARIALQPAFSIVTTIAAVFAVVGAIKSALSPWVLHTTGDEDPAHRGVGAPATRELTLTVDVPEPTEWPESIQSCARAIQLELPPLRPRGGRVTWSSVDPRAVTSITSQEDALDEESSARMVLDLGQETRQQHTAGGSEEHTLVTVTAKVRRQEVEDFKTLVRGLVRRLFAGVPDLLQQHLVYYSTHGVDFVLDEISDQIIDMSKVTYLDVSFHGDPEDDDSHPAVRGTGADVCDLIPDDAIADILGWEVAVTSNPAPNVEGGDDPGQEACVKFDREVDESDWDIGETGNPDAPVYASIEYRSVQLLLSPPLDDGMIDQFSAMVAESSAELAAEGGSLDPTDDIGDEGYLYRSGDNVVGMTLRVGNRVALIGIWNGGLSSAQARPASASDYLEIARIVADRMG